MAGVVDKEAINVNEFKEKWRNILSAEDIHGTEEIDFKDYISANTDISPEILSELDIVCGTNTLNCDDEPKDRDVLLSNPAKGTGLISVVYQSRDLERRSKNVSYRQFLNERRRYLPRKTPWVHDDLKKMKCSHSRMFDQLEAILTVEVFRPFQRSRKMVLDQEFQVLSSQQLTELRDKIRCLSDYVIPGEYSNRPNHHPSQKAKDLYKSGFFFIEGTFYNDMRDPNNQDNSSVIIEWAKKANVGNYTSHIMEETTFADLNIKVGQPYLYEHQGTCQHVIVFSDIRLMHKDDCQDPSKYPVVTLERLHKRVMCRMCAMYTAKWMTKKCLLAPEDPCFYCNSCFQAFHYDSKGNKLFDFKAYHLNTEMK